MNGSDEESLMQQSRKKGRYGRACAPCAAAKRACGGGEPCKRCSALGIAHMCLEMPDRRTKQYVAQRRQPCSASGNGHVSHAACDASCDTVAAAAASVVGVKRARPAMAAASAVPAAMMSHTSRPSTVPHSSSVDDSFRSSVPAAKRQSAGDARAYHAFEEATDYLAPLNADTDAAEAAAQNESLLRMFDSEAHERWSTADAPSNAPAYAEETAALEPPHAPASMTMRSLEARSRSSSPALPPRAAPRAAPVHLNLALNKEALAAIPLNLNVVDVIESCVRASIESTPVPTLRIINDPASQRVALIYANYAWHRQFGFTTDTLAALSARGDRLRLVHESDEAQYEAARRANLEARAPLILLTAQFVTADGTVFQATEKSFVEYSMDGGIRALLISYTDIRMPLLAAARPQSVVLKHWSMADVEAHNRNVVRSVYTGDAAGSGQGGRMAALPTSYPQARVVHAHPVATHDVMVKTGLPAAPLPVRGVPIASAYLPSPASGPVLSKPKSHGFGGLLDDIPALDSLAPYPLAMSSSTESDASGAGAYGALDEGMPSATASTELGGGAPNSPLMGDFFSLDDMAASKRMMSDFNSSQGVAVGEPYELFMPREVFG